ncbi:MAG: hypothetical protein KKD39_01230, partial [Candidatus Altiarchaeota archaeon]|nr:hypothetical protein [Candidatus Altiarchaeota archaeon]
LSAAFLCMITHEQKAGNWLFISAILLGFSALAGIQPLFIIAVLLAYNILANNKIIPKYIFYALLPSTVFSMYMLATNEYFLGDVIYQLERFGLTSIKVSAAAAVFILLSLFREKIMHEAMHLIKIEKEIILPKSLPHMEKLTMLTLLMVHVLASWELIRPITVETMMSGVNYYWVGVAGLFFFPKKHKTSTLIYLAGLILSVFILDRADHMLIPLYPFFSLGTAVFLQHLYKFLKIHAGVALSILVITAPFCIALYNDISTFALGCCIPQMDIQDIQAVTSYVNSQDEGLTLTMSYTVPYFKNATVVTQSIVYAGYPVAYYPVYPRTRFTDNISYNNAQYIVLPEAVIDWTITYHPEFKEIRNWPKINQSGQYSIYKNPNL